MMISQEAPRALQNHVQQLQTQHIANSFAAKMEAAESKYPGLRAKLEKLDYASAAPIIKAVNDTDNAADVMKELIIDNPMKLANLTTLAYTQPAILQETIGALSDSIKRNQQALKETEDQANEPLEPITPSGRVGMDNGQKDHNVSDLRSMLRKRRR
jgi:hypothetical protein